MLRGSCANETARSDKSNQNTHHYISSLIQTILSVPELHRIGRRSGSRTITAGGELHPAPKN